MRYLGTPTTAVNPLGVSDAPALLDYNGFLFQRSQYRSSFPLGGYCIQNPTCPLGDILLWVRLVSLTPEQRTTPCPGESDCTIAFRNCKSFLSKRNCRRTASTDTTRRQLTIRSNQIKDLPLSVGKLRRIHRIPCKGIGAGIGQGEIHLCSLGCSKILIGAGILHLIERIPEHLVMGFLPV